jgi:NAD(P)-dependent dehydrogenase (short-subunit alcohol dehydrogenase family)
MELDVASLESVRAFARAWRARGDRSLHVLVNNAGVFAMGGALFRH